MRYESPTYLKHIAFRDYIKQHKEVREEYERLKGNMASDFRDNRRAYVEGKARFIERITENATRECESSLPWTRTDCPLAFSIITPNFLSVDPLQHSPRVRVFQMPPAGPCEEGDVPWDYQYAKKELGSPV